MVIPTHYNPATHREDGLRHPDHEQRLTRVAEHYRHAFWIIDRCRFRDSDTVEIDAVLEAMGMGERPMMGEQQ